MKLLVQRFTKLIFAILVLFGVGTIVISCSSGRKEAHLKIVFDPKITTLAESICLTDSMGQMMMNTLTEIRPSSGTSKVTYKIRIPAYKTRIGIFVKFKNHYQSPYFVVVPPKFNVELELRDQEIKARFVRRKWFESLAD